MRLFIIRLVQPLLVAQAGEIGVAEADRKVGGLAVVAAAEDLAMAIDPRQGLAVAQRDVEPHRGESSLCSRRSSSASSASQPSPVAADNAMVSRISQRVVFEAGALGRVEQVDFVHRLDQPVLARPVWSKIRERRVGEPQIAEHRQHVLARWASLSG